MSLHDIQEARIRELEDHKLLTHRDLKDIKDSIIKLSDAMEQFTKMYTNQELLKKNIEDSDKRLDKLEANQKWFVTAIILLLATSLVNVVVV